MNTYTDSELINWLEDQEGYALISDDRGHWAISSSGFQECPMEVPSDLVTTFIIEKEQWKKTIREAILYAIQEREENEEEDKQDKEAK